MTKTSVRRVVTGHDQDGRAVFLTDEEIAREDITIPTAKGPNWVGNHSIWSTDEVPASNTGDPGPIRGVSPNVGSGDIHQSGVIFRIVDLPAGSSAPMHRTLTIDYGILLEGECDVLLDSGESSRFQAGDVLIQRGTHHSWINRGDVTCRWAWILIDADPVEVDGRVLGREYLDAPDID